MNDATAIDPSALGSLAVLALIDSASFGTLLIPIWLLTVPGRLRLGRILVYLSTVTTAYFALGIVLVLGLGTLVRAFGGTLESTGFLIGQLVTGVLLMLVSQAMDSKKARARAAARAAARAVAGGGRLLKWRARIMGDDGSGSGAALAGLAVAAVAIEVATMLPYLAAVGIITAQSPGWLATGLILLAYCIVMIAPALILTLGRVAAYARLDRPLARLEQWLTAHANATTAWIIGIVGFLLAARAVFDLGWVGG